MQLMYRRLVCSCIWPNRLLTMLNHLLPRNIHFQCMRNIRKHRLFCMQSRVSIVHNNGHSMHRLHSRIIHVHPRPNRMRPVPSR